MTAKPLISFDEISEDHPFFLDIDESPDWASTFENDSPLKLEIGFGTGNFLIEMAIREPHSNFIGLDFYHKGIRKVITRINKLQLENIRIVYGDAKEKIPQIFEDNQLNEIFINFPDPWPKKRHIKRRLIKPQFIKALSQKLVKKGGIRVATDSKNYAEEILLNFQSEPSLQNKNGKLGFKDKREDTPKTKYEKNFISLGENIYYMDFKKID
ncbi:MAG: tRNA (guanosine(46)-N7)-methyltransferase TrmB [Nitrospinales bacterium]